MTHYIAFLRAINVGGRFVKMEVLRRLFEAAGFSNVQTYIQSGNVLFEAPDTKIDNLEGEIEDRLKEALGYEVATFIRRDSEVIELAQYQPFQITALEEGDTLFISFLRSEPTRELQSKLLSSSTQIDQFHIYDHHLFWLWRRRFGKSTFTNAKVERTLKTQATRRNINTVRKIAAKYLLSGDGEQ